MKHKYFIVYSKYKTTSSNAFSSYGVVEYGNAFITLSNKIDTVKGMQEAVGKIKGAIISFTELKDEEVESDE